MAYSSRRGTHPVVDVLLPQDGHAHAAKTWLIAGAKPRYNSHPPAGVAQLVERNLAKVEVESSRLFSRSRIQRESALTACGASRNERRVPFFNFRLPWRLARASARRRGGRVVMQRPAKPCTPVRFRPPPPIFTMKYPQNAAISLCRYSAMASDLVLACLTESSYSEGNGEGNRRT